MAGDVQETYDARAYNVYQANGTRRFAPGNPGKPPGATSHRRRSLQDIIDAYPDLAPAKLRMEQLQRYRDMIAANQWSYAGERIEVEKLLSEAIRDISQYSYQKLRAVEHVGQLEIVQKLNDLDNMTDDQLRALIGELEALPKQLPAGS